MPLWVGGSEWKIIIIKTVNINVLLLVSQAKKSAASSLVMEGGHKESSSEENKATEEDVGEALKCSEETSPCSRSATDRPNCK